MVATAFFPAQMLYAPNASTAASVYPTEFGSH